MPSLSIERHSRIMVIAPHPDDESLAAGVLIQEAVARGASICIVFMTCGENNAWPQRAIEGCLRIGRTEQIRWGNRRRLEALAALSMLGMPVGDSLFFGYPDQKMTRRLINADNEPARRLSRIIDAWRPTILLSPSLSDIHSDHSATGIYVRQALALLPEKSGALQRLEYLVHTREKADLPDHVITLPANPAQQDRKRRAIACHLSQTRLRPFSLKAFACRPERFIAVPGQPPPVSQPSHPIYKAIYGTDNLIAELALIPRPGAFGRTTLLLAANRRGKAAARLAMTLPGYPVRKRIAVTDARNGRRIGWAAFAGGPFRATVRIDHKIIGPSDQLFIAIKRRFGFFDAAGWREIRLPMEPESAI